MTIAFLILAGLAGVALPTFFSEELATGRFIRSALRVIGWLLLIAALIALFF